MAGENSSCSFFSGPSGDGKQTIFDGTLSSLVVTGKTVAGVAFQCRDVDTTAAASDNSFTRAYLDPNAHTVEVFNGSNGTVTRVPLPVLASARPPTRWALSKHSGQRYSLRAQRSICPCLRVGACSLRSQESA
jgi:hypothetical protein